MNQLSSKDIEKFIPHRQSMALIDNVESVDEKSIKAIAIPDKSWPASDEYSVDPTIMIELIAQATGVLVGWVKRTEMKLGGFGLLVGIRSAEFTVSELCFGKPLEVTSKKLYGREIYGIFQGKVSWNDKTVCEAEIQVFRPEEDLININL